ncbi:MAG: porin [Gammaproteobacteria bacterium]|nr:porin [Gammaproteobacteria bacterium]
MKKRFLVAAIAATMISPIAAYADATVYGNVHLSIDDYDDDVSATNEELEMNNRTSALGVKGKEDLGGGMTALYKVEFGINPDTTASTISTRDQWVGLKGAMGTVKFGTMSSNYKQMGGKIDPMYRTALEGRSGDYAGQSNLHSGSGINRGRSTDTLQYTSPKMGGVSVVVNTTFEGVDDETMGLGVRYSTKSILAYFDYIDMAAGTSTESAMKVGGSYKLDAITLGLQYEATGDLLGEDNLFFSANYQMNENDNIAFTFGSASEDTAGSGNDGSAFALMYNHKMSKRTNVYAGYLTSDIDDNDTDVTDLTFGIRHKF